VTHALLKHQSFLETTAENMSNFLSSYVSDIESQYDWTFKIEKVPEAIEFDFDTLNNWYKKTVKLKKLLIDELNSRANFDQRFPLGEYFVVEWGGVGTNKNLRAKLALYDNVQDLSSITTLSGVSSWSKYLSLRNPSAAIYDSRVAYAINTINYLNNVTEKFFPIPDGRSPKLNLLGIETLFLASKIQTDSAFITPTDKNHRQIASRIKKKYHLPESIAYQAYLDVLHKVMCKLGIEKGEQFKVEMLLFSLAPNVVFEKLIDKVKISA
jgi:hypothetical protein